MLVKDVIEFLERTEFQTVVTSDDEIDEDEDRKFDITEFGMDCYGKVFNWLFIDGEDFEYEFSSIDQLKKEHPEVLDMEVSKRFKIEMYLEQHYNVSYAGNQYFGTDSTVKIHVK